MNTTILTIGIAIVMVFVAALAAPFVIDWSSKRAVFETQLAGIFGAPVRINGEIETGFIPDVRFSFNDVMVGEPEAGAPLTVSRVDVAISPGALLQGAFEIVSARLSSPTLHVRISADGRLISPGLMGAGSNRAVSAETVEIEAGTIVLTDERNGAETRILGIGGAGSMRALNGPFRFDGGYRHGDVPHSIQLATGAFTGGAGRVAVSITPADRPLVVEAEGTLNTGGGGALFNGTVRAGHGDASRSDTGSEATFADLKQLSWRLEGPIEITPDHVFLNEAEFAVGPEDRQMRFTTALSYPFDAKGGIEAVLSSGQLDLDRLIGGGPEQPVSPREAVSAVLRAMRDTADAFAFSHPVQLSADVSTVVVGGEVLQGARLDIERNHDDIAVNAFTLRLPGTADLTLSGRVDGLDFGGFAGYMRLDAVRLDQTVRWATASALPASRDVAAASRLMIEGDMAITGSAVSLRNLKGTFDEAPVNGDLSFVPAGPGQTGSIVLQLNAEKLDLTPFALLVRQAALAAVGDGTSNTAEEPTAANPLAYRIVADVSVDEAVLAGNSMRDADIDLRLADGVLDIRALSIGDLAGARLEGIGRMSGLPDAPAGQLDLAVSATRLSGLVESIGALTVGDDDFSVWQRRVEAFAPLTADLSLSIDGTNDTETSAVMRLDGNAGGSEIALGARFQGAYDNWRAGTLEVEGAADSIDGARLLTQLGLPFETALPGGAGAFSFKTSGALQSELAVEGQLEALNTVLTVGGVVTEPLTAGARFSGMGQMRSGDATMLSQFLQIPTDGLRAVPLNLVSDVTATPDIIELHNLNGEIAAQKMTGAFTFERGARGVRAKAEMTADNTSLPWLVSVMLGNEGVNRGAPGIDAVAPLEFTKWASVPLTLRAQSQILDLSEDVRLSDTSFIFESGPETLRVRDLSGRLHGGELKGSVELETTALGVEVAGDATLEGADVSAALSETLGLRAIEGVFDARIQAGGRGRSLSGLIASLEGQGSYRLRDGQLHRLNPSAFSLIVRAADAGLEADEERVEEIFSGHLQTAPLLLQPVEGSFSIESGVLRFPRTAAEGEGADIAVTGRLDLTNRSVDANIFLTVDRSTPEAGALPSVDVAVQGPWRAAERKVDVSALTGYLTVRRFEDEVERIETLQAEIIERERLERELVRLRQDETMRAPARLNAEDGERGAAPAAPPVSRPAAAPAPAPVLPPLEPARVISPPVQPASPGPGIQTQSLPPSDSGILLIRPPQRPENAAGGPAVITIAPVPRTDIPGLYDTVPDTAPPPAVQQPVPASPNRAPVRAATPRAPVLQPPVEIAPRRLPPRSVAPQTATQPAPPRDTRNRPRRALTPDN